MAPLYRSNTTPTVLVVEDKESMLTMLSYNLRRHGFIVYTAVEGVKAMDIAEEKKPHIVVIDAELADMSGVELCAKFRENDRFKNTPIIMLTTEDNPIAVRANAEGGAQGKSEAHNDNAEKDKGPDEVVLLPMSPNEIVTKIKATYRRNRPPIKSTILEFDDVKMNLASYKVTKGGKPVHLGPTEFSILQCLMEFPKRTLSREYIMTYVWGQKNVIEARTIDVHINRLRTALRGANDEPPIIETIRSAGYCLRRSSDNKA